MEKRVMKLASGGKRLGAYCLDKIVPFILFCVLMTGIAKLSMLSEWNDMYGYGFGYNIGGNGLNALGTVASFFVVIAISIAYLVVQIFFYSKSKTIGKAILGLQVINSADGKPTSLLKMILREWFAKKASGAVFLLGYLWILIDDKNRAWHDKIMDTYVVDLKETVKCNTKTTTDETQNIEPEEHEIQDVEIIDPEGGTSIG